MVRIGRTFPLLVACLTAAAFWATPPPARADFQLRLYEDGVFLAAPGVLTDGGSGVITYSGNAGDFNLAFTYATSNSPGADNVGIVTVANTRVTNTASATHTLTIEVSSQGFNVPTGDSLTLLNSASGTVSRGTISGSFNSYADRNNALFGTSDLAAPALTFTGTAGTLSASFSGSTELYPLTSTGLYSITNVGTYTFGAGASITLTGGLSEVHAPAPPGLVLALSGMPLLGFGCWFRGRRRATQQP
jgi:hypothetical protein